MRACACALSVHPAVTTHRLGNDQYTRPSVRKQKADSDPKWHHSQKGQQQGGKPWPEILTIPSSSSDRPCT